MKITESTPTVTATSTAKTHQLRAAAQQFEAMMLGELLKPLQEHTSMDDGSSSEGGPLQAFGTEAVAGALARSGALGFADRLVRSVEHRSGAVEKK